MLRFIYVIIMNLFRAPYIIPKMRRESEHPDRYSEEERYNLARHVIRLMKFSGKVHTKSYGAENLPKEGGCYGQGKVEFHFSEGIYRFDPGETTGER